MPESAHEQRTETKIEDATTEWRWPPQGRAALMAGWAAVAPVQAREMARALANSAAKRAATEAAVLVDHAKARAADAGDALRSLAKSAARSSQEAKTAVLEAADRHWRRGAATKQFNLLKNQRPSRPDQLVFRGCDTGSLDAVLALDAEPYRRR